MVFPSQLSQHYKHIDESYPVIIGQELWYRITGFPNFYERLVIELDTMILDIETENFFTEGYMALAKEIEDSSLFDFS